KQKGHVVEVDLFDRVPTPYGLVRAGVAPDHQKIKSVTTAFDKVAAHPRFRFFGGIEFGRDLTAADLRRRYHQIVYTTGAQTDRRMGIPGEDLKGSHPATEFVAWYNGHPDYRDLRFDLSHERAAVVGVGNVAVDVARILCRSADELAELADADVSVVPDEVELDPLTRAALEANPDRATAKKVEILQGYAVRKPSGKSEHLIIRFLVSPVELIGNEDGEVTAIKLVKNRLEAGASGALSPKPTGIFEELPVGLVFRSVGYKGVPLPDVPFHESW